MRKDLTTSWHDMRPKSTIYRVLHNHIYPIIKKIVSVVRGVFLGIGVFLAIIIILV